MREMEMSLIGAIKCRCVEVGECWEWQGCMASRTGQIPMMRMPSDRDPKRSVKNVCAVVWQDHVMGPIPPGYQVWRQCRNSRCVNPEHLRCTTKKKMAAAVKQFGAYKPKPDRIAKLTQERRSRGDIKVGLDAARQIRADRGTRTALELAAEHGVDESLIYRIWRHEAWREVVSVGSVFGLAGHLARAA